MGIGSPSTLLLAGALASPAIAAALKGSDVSATDVALRYLICVPVAWVMLSLLRAVTRDFGSQSSAQSGGGESGGSESGGPRRRHADRAHDTDGG